MLLFLFHLPESSDLFLVYVVGMLEPLFGFKLHQFFEGQLAKFDVHVVVVFALVLVGLVVVAVVVFAVGSVNMVLILGSVMVGFVVICLLVSGGLFLGLFLGVSFVSVVVLFLVFGLMLIGLMLLGFAEGSKVFMSQESVVAQRRLQEGAFGED